MQSRFVQTNSKLKRRQVNNVNNINSNANTNKQLSSCNVAQRLLQRTKKPTVAHSTSCNIINGNDNAVDNDYNNNNNNNNNNNTINNRTFYAPSEILEYLYLGSYHSATNLQELEARNIKNIINISAKHRNLFAAKINYLTIRASDTCSQELLPTFHVAIDFIEKAKKRNEGVLVHCTAGVSRSTSLVIAYLMKCYKKSLTDSYLLVKKKRTQVAPNYGFICQLQQYELLLFNKTSISISPTDSTWSPIQQSEDGDNDHHLEFFCKKSE